MHAVISIASTSELNPGPGATVMEGLWMPVTNWSTAAIRLEVARESHETCRRLAYPGGKVIHIQYLVDLLPPVDALGDGKVASRETLCGPAEELGPAFGHRGKLHGVPQWRPLCSGDFQKLIQDIL